MMATI